MSSTNSNIPEKNPSESHAEVIVRMFPSDANPAGNVFGGEILKGFSFAMILGVIIGTFSSIFVAAPILKYTNVSQKTVLKEDIKNN